MLNLPVSAGLRALILKMPGPNFCKIGLFQISGASVSATPADRPNVSVGE
jgi:hypothetical protein